jgi:hypothetical protein
MRRTALIAALLGVVFLGLKPILAQGYNTPPPPEPGIPGHFGQTANPYPGGPASDPIPPGIPYPPGTNQYPIQLPGPYGDGPSAPGPGQPPTVALADQLLAQADAFLRAFVPTARIVPEGGRFIADTLALRDAAARFRQAAAAGAPPAVLAAGFRDMDACWRRLDTRMYRVSRGRLGPNIATALQMGRTIGQIRGLL